MQFWNGWAAGPRDEHKTADVKRSILLFTTVQLGFGGQRGILLWHRRSCELHGHPLACPAFRELPARRLAMIGYQASEYGKGGWRVSQDRSGGNNRNVGTPDVLGARTERMVLYRWCPLEVGASRLMLGTLT